MFSSDVLSGSARTFFLQKCLNLAPIPHLIRPKLGSWRNCLSIRSALILLLYLIGKNLVGTYFGHLAKISSLSADDHFYRPFFFLFSFLLYTFKFLFFLQYQKIHLFPVSETFCKIINFFRLMASCNKNVRKFRPKFLNSQENKNRTI